ncbi:hypothetical protein D9619_003124 [Psilocybe cf. subviscida]|uniref:SH3 domain-containing protein n=1 Tax=Psilocybe cf. subviscida TaxID=2480587 RepID=A0A8H5AW16_9AGAR|nr:hypothetical protein D9619_003124 [Psilocybe cf. subviscida]
MKFNPLPQPLPKECEKAAKIFKSFVDNSNNGLDGVIPRTILENAKGFAIFTIVKAGFLFSARAGSGIVIARLENGCERSPFTFGLKQYRSSDTHTAWSAPSAIGTAGYTFHIASLPTYADSPVLNLKAIRSFMAAGSLSLGGNMSVALGPLGRTGEASGAVNTNGKVASMYSYSKTRGLFGGVSIEGSVIVERQDANAQAYESPVTARMLLGGHVDPPSWASPLIKTLDACTGMPGNNRGWIDDNNSRPRSGSYAFGGLGSPGSSIRTPSFLKKKKKSDTSPFPPAEWGEQSDSGSYFSSKSPSHSRNLTWGGDSSTNNFNTKFESDYAPDRPAVGSKQSSYSPTNPFAGPPRLDSEPLEYVDYQINSHQSSPTPAFTHNRSKSLHHYQSPTSYSIDDDKLDSLPSYASPPRTTGSTASVPHLQPREELRKPLLPHEGLARVIALFDFSAAEASDFRQSPGDLSFKKGDVIVVTQKTNSTDDWWTGKVDGRQGIFPANFVEVV